MIYWQYYPRSATPTSLARNVVRAFEEHPEIDSSTHTKSSNEILSLIAPSLQKLGFLVEIGKKRDQKIRVPVLYGLNGRIDKSFEADAHHPEDGFVLEVEAGRGFANNQFMKDLFQACMMHDITHLCIAVRNTYRDSQDFPKVCKFFDTLYASNRLNLPLQGILIIGY